MVVMVGCASGSGVADLAGVGGMAIIVGGGSSCEGCKSSSLVCSGGGGPTSSSRSLIMWSWKEA